jgi:hypothetical protein
MGSLYAENPKFQRMVDEWLVPSLQFYREAGDELDGNDVFRNQGKCIILSDLIKSIQTAGEVQSRFAHNRSEG